MPRALLDEKFPESTLTKAVYRQWREQPYSEVPIAGCPEYFSYVKQFMESGQLHLPRRDILKKFFVEDLKAYGVIGKNEPDAIPNLTQDEDISLEELVEAFQLRFADRYGGLSVLKMLQLKLSNLQQTAVWVVHALMPKMLGQQAQRNDFEVVNETIENGSSLVGQIQCATLGLATTLVRSRDECDEYLDCFGFAITHLGVTNGRNDTLDIRIDKQ